MFIKIINKKQLIEELKTRSSEEIVIHYNCLQCGDELVTYSEEIDENMIEFFEHKNFIMIGLECINCGNITLSLNWEYINGIEIVD